MMTRDPVGEVHLGCVLLLTGNSSQISIKSELKSGQLLRSKNVNRLGHRWKAGVK